MFRFGWSKLNNLFTSQHQFGIGNNGIRWVHWVACEVYDAHQCPRAALFITTDRSVIETILYSVQVKVAGARTKALPPSWPIVSGMCCLLCSAACVFSGSCSSRHVVTSFTSFLLVPVNPSVCMPEHLPSLGLASTRARASSMYPLAGTIYCLVPFLPDISPSSPSEQTRHHSLASYNSVMFPSAAIRFAAKQAQFGVVAQGIVAADVRRVDLSQWWALCGVLGHLRLHCFHLACLLAQSVNHPPKCTRAIATRVGMCLSMHICGEQLSL